MMLRAKMSNGDLITLAQLSRKKIEQLRKNAQFFCPDCNERVIMKAGKKVIPHFAHRHPSHCSYYTKGESLYHEKGKLLLYEWLATQQLQVKLEHYIKEIKQRPDVFVSLNNRQIAFEFQCANMSASIVRNRVLGYQQINIVPIWIIGANRFKRITNHLFRICTEIIQYFHQFSPTYPITSYFFCPDRRQIAILHDIHVLDYRTAFGKVTFHDLNQLILTDLFQYETLSTMQRWNIWKNKQHHFRLHVRSRAYGQAHEWRTWLYNRGIYIDQLPSIINIPISSQLRMKVPLYNWQSRFIIDFLQPLPIGDTFHLYDALSFMKPFILHERYFPLLPHLPNPIKAYLSVFTSLNKLKQISTNTFQKIKDCTIYDTIEEAVTGDQLFYEKVIRHIKLKEG